MPARPLAVTINIPPRQINIPLIPLFIQHQEALNFYGVTAVLLKHLRRINHKVKNLDQIRASVITHWVKIHDLRKAQYMAGHRHISSTEDYKQQLLDELQADVKKFHPL